MKTNKRQQIKNNSFFECKQTYFVFSIVNKQGDFVYKQINQPFVYKQTEYIFVYKQTK